MSIITTRSKFYYGHTVTTLNQAIDFSEGGGELQANIAIGTYTLQEFLDAIKAALDGVGALTYTVTVNRTTRVITIAATGTFELLCNTGSRLGSSAWSLMGYATTADRTGAATYDGDSGSGSEYITQAIINEYIAADDWQLAENADVSVTATGLKQTACFGEGKRVQMNIRHITNQAYSNKDCDPNDIYNNPTGIEDARSLMLYLTAQGRAEFIPDISLPSTFEKVILEKTNKDGKGTAFALMAMDWFGHLETEKLLFRVLS